MLFNSIPFILFLACFLSLLRFANHSNTIRWAYLSTASCLFYGWWDWRYLILILISTAIDFLAGLGILRKRHQVGWLFFSLIGNLGILFTFKYFNFFTELAGTIVHFLGVQITLPNSGLVLPIGISFYTFQSMSYTLDVYRGRIKPTRNYLHFLSYVSLFPQLVAGPIVRARELLPVLTQPLKSNENDRWCGFRLVTLGFVKKMVVADNLAPLVEQAFRSEVNPGSCLFWWVTGLCFFAQIYCDFSGYSDIARGLCRFIGFKIPRNFDQPFLAVGLKAFWSRWHISLTSWLLDYVWTPLMRVLPRSVRDMIAIWIVMLLSGLWHGAGLTFVLWGALHGLLLCMEQRMSWPQRLLTGWRKLVGICLTWMLWIWSLVLFRAESVKQGLAIQWQMLLPGSNMVEQMIGFFGGLELLPILLLVPIEIAVHRHRQREDWLGPWQGFEPFLVALGLIICVLFRGPQQQFIYFQF